VPLAASYFASRRFKALDPKSQTTRGHRALPTRAAKTRLPVAHGRLPSGDEAGLPQCSAHGLRKAGATIAADGGATDRQLMAMFDWTTSSQANVYTAAANKKRLAREGSNIMVGHFEKGEVAHLDKKS
jgi:hypothetical protein